MSNYIDNHITNNIIKLNVRGTIIECDEQILRKSDYFNDLLQDIPYDGNPIDINHSIKTINRIISHLNDNKFPIQYRHKYKKEID